MSSADQAWLKQAVERQIEDLSADVKDIWERSEKIQEALDQHSDNISDVCAALTGLGDILQKYTQKTNELCDAYNNIAAALRKLCDLLARPAPAPAAPPSPFSELFGSLGVRQASPPPKAAKPRKPKLKIVKDEEPAS